MVKIIIEAFYVRTLYLFRFLVLNRVEYSSTFIPGTKLISSDLKLGQRRCYSSEAILTGFPQNLKFCTQLEVMFTYSQKKATVNFNLAQIVHFTIIYKKPMLINQISSCYYS